MATSITVYDLENYPDNPKTVTIDQKSVVPVGGEGDEKWVFSCITSAYGGTGSTAIQDLYIQEIKTGWLKSSGFVGTGGKFTITDSSNNLKVKIDNSAGASGGGGYYTITLASGTNLTADVIADDLETKIRALPDDDSWITGDDPYKLAYINASVEYKDGKFWIISGSVSAYYTGTSRSSVKIAKVTSDTCYETLGFDLSIDSQTIAGISIKEVLLTSSYSIEDATLSIGAGTSVTAGDGLMITDGTNVDYFTALSGTIATSVAVSTTAINGHAGILHSYITGVSKVQVLRQQDPDQAPLAWHDTVDSIVRHSIKSIANQIYFAS